MTRKEILEMTIDFDDAINRIVRLENENIKLKKACEETQELLDKQIEATYKLDKENAELKHQLTHRNCLDCSNHSSKLRMRNLDLEKENAELKKDKKELCHSISEGGKACVYLNEQLTNAKGIIIKLKALYLSPVVTKDDVKQQDEILNEAEQFLKYSEV